VVGEKIEFTLFGLAGEETPVVGELWETGPRVGAHWSLWVIPDDPRPEGLDASAVAVVRADTRHRVGRVVLRPQGALWRPRGGRYVDPGELYTEAHPASPTGRLTATGGSRARPGPRVIAAAPLSRALMNALSGVTHSGGARPEVIEVI
jgi:hypothetical protein